MRLRLRLRLRFKQLLCVLGLGDRLIEFCQDCGARQPIVWWAGATLWYDVGCEQHDVLCPSCFSERAAKRGYFIQWWPDARKFSDAPSHVMSNEELSA